MEDLLHGGAGLVLQIWIVASRGQGDEAIETEPISKSGADTNPAPRPLEGNGGVTMNKQWLLFLVIAVVIILVVIAGIMASCAKRARSSWQSLSREYWDQTTPFAFDVSPSGRTLVFTAKGAGGRDLFMMDVKTKHVTPLAQTPQFEAEVRFLDENRVVVSAVEDFSDLASAAHLYTLNLRDGTRHRITRDINVRDATITPLSENEVLFIRSRIEKRLNPVGALFYRWVFLDVYGVVEGVYVVDTRTGDIWAVGGAYDTFVIKCAENIILKNRRQVIMENTGSVNYLDLVTLNAPLGESNLRQVRKKRLARNAHTPALSPDERFVYFVQDKGESGHAIVRVDIETLTTTRLAIRPKPVVMMRACRDSLFFMEGSRENVELWRIDVAENKAEKVLSGGDFVNPP